MTQSIDIIILSHNRLRFLKATILAIQRRTKHPFRITVCDNKSDDDVRKYLIEQREEGNIHKLILHDKNYWHRGWQKGVKNTMSNPFVITDPDIIVPKPEYFPNMEGNQCWLTHMLVTFRRYEQFARLGMLLQAWTSPFIPTHIRKERRDRRKNHGLPIYGDHGEIGMRSIDTTLQLIDRAVFNRTCGFTHSAPYPAFTQIDQMGYKTGVYTKLAAIHLGGDDYRVYPEYTRKKLQQSRDWLKNDDVEALMRKLEVSNG